jgi:aquaporin Z
MNKYLTEFIGTFFLVFTIGMAGQLAGNLAPLAIGSALMVMIYMGGHISGGHYNPAVTLGVFIRGRLPVKDVLPYMIAQLAGALLAATVVLLLTDKTDWAPKPGRGVSIAAALAAEGIFTFALVLVVLNVATSKDHPNNSFYGLAIGFTVLTGAFAVGKISGGAFNPAVGAGPILMDSVINLVAGVECESLWNLWLYLVGPFCGGIAAAYVFLAQNPHDP